ncbi:urease accessory protein UreE [Sulfitobacter albidus]|uniref:Urease accessory protein UreE n=2 Tax=Sulfitobacter albidus TaxID=2829501 RepID=A0A975JEV9_9RHOB|nr:urease accessory protein UreE [Sulfitobacter albidus]QUJ77236.1 urease accessory protein UreE [Sulfitobacter albidus]
MHDELAQTVLRAAEAGQVADRISLDYEARFLRRKVLTADGGTRVLVDLESTTSLEDGDVLACDSGARIAVRAAPEPLLRVTGPNLARLAWHIGNRHTPCQVGDDHLLIRNDPVIAHMLGHVGAALEEITAPFTPEGGAYGHGRTHSHEHVATAHEH